MVEQFIALKAYLVDSSGLSRDAMHIHMGLLIATGFLLLFNRPRDCWRAIAVLAVFAAGGEVMDRLNYRSWRVADTVGDLINTLMWPIALTMLAASRKRERQEAEHRTAQRRAIRARVRRQLAEAADARDLQGAIADAFDAAPEAEREVRRPAPAERKRAA